MMDQRDKAVLLRELHHRDEPLVFVNVWDAVSARIAESLGQRAIATSSGAIAFSEGYADGERIPRERMLARVATIADAVGVPVTADLEGGYGPTVADAVETARGAIAAGAVGLNFEDGTREPGVLLDVALQSERIAAIRRAAEGLGVPLVVNARTDVYHGTTGMAAGRLREAVARAQAYLAAGADSIFVPFVTDAATIAELAAAIPAPLNVLAGANTPGVAALARLGVKRISTGSSPGAYALAMFREAALEIRDRGTFSFAARRIPPAEMAALLER
jgi:2-methylisocitrate lyase-like PEP mutase family enzyme